MIVDLKGLKQISQEGEYTLYEYSPSLLKLYYVDFEPMPLFRRGRLTIEYLHKGHYKVYYLSINGSLVGHCLVAPGGRRLRCSSDNDIVLGPYFIEESERGKGYSEKLIALTLQYYTGEYRYAFDYIKKSNVPSIRASLKCGFEKVGELNKVGLLHKLTQVEEDGEYEIYRVSNPRVR